MFLSDFYDWLLKTYPEKAKKFKAICAIANINLDCDLIWMGLRYFGDTLSHFVDYLVEFVIQCEPVTYDMLLISEYLFDNNYMSFEQLTNLIAHAAKLDNFEPFHFLALKNNFPLENLYKILEELDRRKVISPYGRLKLESVFSDLKRYSFITGNYFNELSKFWKNEKSIS